MTITEVTEMIFCKLTGKSITSIKAYDYHYSMYDETCKHCNFCTKEKDDVPVGKKGVLMRNETKDEIMAWGIASVIIYFIFRVIVMGGN